MSEQAALDLIQEYVDFLEDPCGSNGQWAKKSMYERCREVLREHRGTVTVPVYVDFPVHACPHCGAKHTAETMWKHWAERLCGFGEPYGKQWEEE